MGVGASGFAYIGSHRRSMRLWVINTIEFYSAGLVQQLWGFRALQKLRNGERRGWPDDGVAGGVAVLAGLLRAINKRRCQHPPLDLRLSTLPLSLSFLSTLFFSVFIPLDIFFPSRASPLEKFRRLLLSRTRFNLPCSFSDRLFSFLPLPHFFIRVVPKRFAVLCLCFKIEVHSTFSSWSILRVPAYTLPVSSSFSFFSVCLFVERRNPLDFTLDFSHRFSHERLDFYFRKTALALSDTLSLFAFPAKGILACTLRSNV